MTIRAAEVHTCGQSPAVVERPEPVPSDGEVTVDVVAVPITPLDVLCATGTSYFGTPRTPYVPGVQGVGTVAGRLVWFPTSAGMAPGDGSMAERVVVAEQDLVDLPAGVEPTLMAALGLSSVAALMGLTERGGLQAGERVIVLGGGGVVGQAAIQLAKLAGAARVVAAARSQEGQQRAAAAGADAVIALDTEDQAELERRFAAVTDGPIDLVLDPLYGVPAAAAARSLAPGGRLVNLGGSAGETSPIDSATLRGRSLRLLGYTNNALTSEQRSTAVATVATHAANGSLSVAHEVCPLDEVAEAWERQATGRTTGRIVLRLSGT